MSGRIDVEDNIAQAARVVSSVHYDGFALLALKNYESLARDRALAIMDNCLELLGEPIQVFARYPRWRPIGVDLNRSPNRSEGIGESPLHMDFVNSEYPPDFVLLYCEQSDPAGGGETVLAPVSAVRELADDLKEKLRGNYYSDGQLVGLKNVGVDINPFAVLADGEQWDFRYTGQLLNAAMAEDVRVAVRALDAALRSRALSVHLAGGEAVVIDQHRIVHGRLALGFDQREIPPEERRLVWQRFGRRRS
jgi:hypothetical protein